jgi:hypothetical protein
LQAYHAQYYPDRDIPDMEVGGKEHFREDIAGDGIVVKGTYILLHMSLQMA